jgi:hypothetical protein
MAIYCFFHCLGYHLELFVNNVFPYALPTEFDGCLVGLVSVMVKEWAVVDPDTLRLEKFMDKIDVLEDIIGGVDKKASHNRIPRLFLIAVDL